MESLEQQFLKAYDDFSDAIFRHCYFRVRNREEAGDLVQETFTKTWQYISGGSNVENIRAFLYRVANNLIIDRSRKKKTQSLEELKERGFEPQEEKTENIEDKIEAKEVAGALGLLPEDYRDVLIMRFIDDMALGEIAKILGETENTVSVRIHRGIKKLRGLSQNAGLI